MFYQPVEVRTSHSVMRWLPQREGNDKNHISASQTWSLILSDFPAKISLLLFTPPFYLHRLRLTWSEITWWTSEFRNVVVVKLNCEAKWKVFLTCTDIPIKLRKQNLVIKTCSQWREFDIPLRLGLDQFFSVHGILLTNLNKLKKQREIPCVPISCWVSFSNASLQVICFIRDVAIFSKR